MLLTPRRLPKPGGSSRSFCSVWPVTAVLLPQYYWEFLLSGFLAKAANLSIIRKISWCFFRQASSEEAMHRTNQAVTLWPFILESPSMSFHLLFCLLFSPPFLSFILSFCPFRLSLSLSPRIFVCGVFASIPSAFEVLGFRAGVLGSSGTAFLSRRAQICVRTFNLSYCLSMPRTVL